MSSWLLGGVGSAVVALAASPYLARLSRTVADPADPAWWRGADPSRRRLVAAAAVGGVLGLLAGYAVGWSAAWPAFAALALAATPLVLVDIEHHRLPDRLVLGAAIAAAALLCLAAAVHADWHSVGRAASASGVVLAAFGVIALIWPASMGFGDVKLAGLLAGYLGWQGWSYVLYGIFAGFAIGAVMALALLLAGRLSLKGTIAFGPALIVGALLVAAAH